MARVIFDFSEAKEFDRTPIPPGVYVATIDATYAEEVKTGREKGTPYITLGFNIVEPEEYRGRTVFGNYMLSGPGSGNARQLLRNLGFYKDDFGDLFDFDTRSLHGYMVKIRVIQSKRRDGSVANDVILVMPADSDAA